MQHTQSQKTSGVKCETSHYFVLLDLSLVTLHVSGRRLRLDLSDSLLSLRQPVRELLQLLLLEIHQDFVESGAAGGGGKDRKGGERKKMRLNDMIPVSII